MEGNVKHGESSEGETRETRDSEKEEEERDVEGEARDTCDGEEVFHVVIMLYMTIFNLYHTTRTRTHSYIHTFMYVRTTDKYLVAQKMDKFF